MTVQDPNPFVTAILAAVATGLIGLPLAAWRWWLAFIPAMASVALWGVPAVIPALLAATLVAYVMRRPRSSDRFLLERHNR
ncbi:MAG: hypothetical protein LAT64_14275 [Phycisphaerales bacterium]|nr:hypothetical protein [Planctomycetota bacterium]MCH8509918.1 hypothetical protein [Phycisphaerales bacterium]